MVSDTCIQLGCETKPRWRLVVMYGSLPARTFYTCHAHVMGQVELLLQIYQHVTLTYVEQ